MGSLRKSRRPFMRGNYSRRLHGLGFDWGGLFSNIANDATKIVTAKLQQPSYPSVYAQPQYYAPPLLPATSSLGTISPTLLLGGLGLLAIVLVSR